MTGCSGATQLLEVLVGIGATNDVDSTRGTIVGALIGSVIEELRFKDNE